MVLVRDASMGDEHTLIIMILIGMVTIQLAQQFDNIGICIGTTKRVTRTIKAKNELLGLWFLGLYRPVGFSVRHNSGCEMTGGRLGGPYSSDSSS